MTKTEYAKYLQSKHWKLIRGMALAYKGSACERCAIPRWLAEIAYDQDLHVHHLTYENVGSEKMKDLAVLCRRCHEIETFNRTDLREIKTTDCSICGSTHWDKRSSWCSACESIIASGISSSTLRAGEDANLPWGVAAALGTYLAKYDRDATEIFNAIERAYLITIDNRKNLLALDSMESAA